MLYTYIEFCYICIEYMKYLFFFISAMAKLVVLVLKYIVMQNKFFNNSSFSTTIFFLKIEIKRIHSLIFNMKLKSWTLSQLVCILGDHNLCLQIL